MAGLRWYCARIKSDFCKHIYTAFRYVVVRTHLNNFRHTGVRVSIWQKGRLPFLLMKKLLRGYTKKSKKKSSPVYHTPLNMPLKGSEKRSLSNLT